MLRLSLSVVVLALFFAVGIGCGELEELEPGGNVVNELVAPLGDDMGDFELDCDSEDCDE